MLDPANLAKTVSFAWAAKFGLPPNDERLLRVTAREALEQINGVYAFEQIARERAPQQPEEVEHEEDPFGIEDEAAGQRFMGGAVLAEDGESIRQPGKKKGQVTVVGPEAQAVADKPHLTKGTEHYWPEWDELELAETDPSRPPLKIQW